MEKFEIKQSAESSEGKEKKEIRQEIANALAEIRGTEIFDTEFLDPCVLAVFGEKKTYEFKNQNINEAKKEDFSRQDFMQGRRTDFVGINPKKEFESRDMRALDDRLFLPFIFIEGKLTYNEFVAHEMAHNLFDKEYTERVGRYKEDDNITDVSEGYREKIKDLIIPLVKKNYPDIGVEQFSFSRQQIVEIFALLYEREFCRRANDNAEMHNKVEEKIDKFSSDPEKILTEFNEKNSRHCTMNDFYEENHILSLIVSPMLEKEYPEWEKRKDIFWE